MSAIVANDDGMVVIKTSKIVCEWLPGWGILCQGENISGVGEVASCKTRTRNSNSVYAIKSCVICATVVCFVLVRMISGWCIGVRGWMSVGRGTRFVRCALSGGRALQYRVLGFYDPDRRSMPNWCACWLGMGLYLRPTRWHTSSNATLVHRELSKRRAGREDGSDDVRGPYDDDEVICGAVRSRCTRSQC